MGLFSRRRGASGDRKATKDDLAQLREWAGARTGVEAFVEPQTSVTQTTVLLVAGDGEFTRRRVASPQAAADFARKVGIPVYDTNRVGYPQRMRDYSMRVSGRDGAAAPSTSGASATALNRRSPRELAAISALESIAGVGETTSEPDDEELRRIWRLARSRAHPDRRGGDRTAWDEVETAARALGLQGQKR